jgi:putative MATE family efflux protein
MQDLTTGSLAGHLLRTTTFMLVGMIFQTLYLLVDLFWVSSLGADAVAAVGISGNLSFLVLAISQVLGVGATTLVSHASGSKDHDKALFMFNQSQVLSTTAGVVFLVVAMLGREAYARGLSADGPTLEMAMQYLAWFIPAMALQFAMVAMGAALRGTGNFRVGMIVQSGTVIINIVLAPILIFGWGTGYKMGVSGAALSTLVAVVVGVGWLAWYFVDEKAYLHFRLSDWTPDFGVWWRMLKIGLPAGAEFALMGLYLVIVYAISKPFGAVAQAGFGIGFRIVQSAFLPVVALGFAVSPVAGQNFGAKQPHRVIEAFKAAAGMAAIAMLLIGALVYFLAERLIGFFSPDAEVIRVGVEYLHIVAGSFVFSGVTFVSSSMFQAMGNTLPSLATSAVRIAVSIVPVLILSRQAGFELKTIWYISVVSVILQMVLNLALLKREFRLRLA